MNELQQILHQLDIENDDHWTATGLPVVDVVSARAGRTVTRTEITQAWPKFDRDELRRFIAEGEKNKQPAENPPAPPSGSDDDGQAQTGTGDVTHKPLFGDEGGDEGEGDGQKKVTPMDLIEQATNLANSDEYRNNYELQTFLRGYQVAQRNIHEVQKRLDLRAERRNK